MLITSTILAAIAVAYLNLRYHREIAALSPEERDEYERDLAADVGNW